MAYKDYLNRKVDEIAHNEILAFLMVILGMVTLIGGLLVTIVVVEAPRWLLIFPYHQSPSNPSTVLGLILTLTGFVLLSVGFISVIYYDRKRSWATRQLEKFPQYKKEDALEPIRKALKKYTDKR